jgi:hypothetical protein
MKRQIPNYKQLKILTSVGVFCLAIPLYIYTLWISIFDLGDTQAERVTIFKSYFPNFLQGRWDTTYIGIIFSILAIIFSLKGLKLPNKIWKIMNIIILIMSSLLLFLNIFSMM